MVLLYRGTYTYVVCLEVLHTSFLTFDFIYLSINVRREFLAILMYLLVLPLSL